MKIRTYNIKIFIADILWISGHFLKILSEKLEYGADKIMKVRQFAKTDEEDEDDFVLETDL